MSFEVPEDRSYLSTHEWAAVDEADGAARVGITDFAQDELGDVVFVEFPDVDTYLDAGEQFGTIESIKAVSDLYSPVAGSVSAVNDALRDQPELVNEDPYGEGWMIQVDIDGDPESALGDVLTAVEYRDRTE